MTMPLFISRPFDGTPDVALRSGEPLQPVAFLPAEPLQQIGASEIQGMGLSVFLDSPAEFRHPGMEKGPTEIGLLANRGA